jgi:hypothetical protein
VTLLGVTIDGRNKVFGVAPAKLHALCRITRVIADSPPGARVSGARLSRVVGAWTWAMLVRRPTLSAMTHTYAYVRRNQFRRARLWASVKRELRVLIGLAPLLFTDLGAPDADPIVATDASDSGFGVVAWWPQPGERLAPWGPTHAEILNEQHRQSDAGINCNDTKAQGPSCGSGTAIPLHGQRVGDAQAGGSNQQFEHGRGTRAIDIADASWRTIMALPWRSAQQTHINIKEMRAVRSAVQWTYSLGHRSFGSVIGLLTDSMVVVGAIRKGRCSSFRLLTALRHVNALLLAGGARLDVHYVPSALNPADEPSRRFERDGEQHHQPSNQQQSVWRDRIRADQQ